MPTLLDTGFLVAILADNTHAMSCALRCYGVSPTSC